MIKNKFLIIMCLILLCNRSDWLLVYDWCFCGCSVCCVNINGKYFFYIFWLSCVSFLCCGICNNDSCYDIWFVVNLVVLEKIIMI